MKQAGDNQQTGQSLVEILVVLGILVLLVLGLITGTTLTLKNIRLAQTKSQAVKLAQEGLELTRQLRNKNWEAFRAYHNDECLEPDSGTCMWCLDGNGLWQASTEACPTISNDHFNRRIIFKWVSDVDPNKEKMEVISLVYWVSGYETYNVQLDSIFTQWK